MEKNQVEHTPFLVIYIFKIPTCAVSPLPYVLKTNLNIVKDGLVIICIMAGLMKTENIGSKSNRETKREENFEISLTLSKK